VVTSNARSSFLVGIEALRKSIDSPLVSAGDTVGMFLRRGLTIVSYNLLEAFMVERLTEISAHINSGISHFTDLPLKLQLAAAQDLLKIANAQLQWSTNDVQSKLDYARDVGQSLAANTGPLNLSPLMWQWSGSNMSLDDFTRAMRLFHVEQPWTVIEHISKRIGSPLSDSRKVMEALLRERNKCAHQSSYSVSNLWIRAVPNQLLHLALGADVCISFGANMMHHGDTSFYKDEKWFNASRVTIRFVRERKRDWADIVEGSTRAVHVNLDRDAVKRQAITSARGRGQVIVVQDSTHQTLDWTYPELP
jgi:hypothetical protein